MQIILEGSRFTDRSWLQAHQAPVEMLPHLSEADTDFARRHGVSDEEYARKLYAGLLSEPELAALVERLGLVLAGFLGDFLPGAVVVSITMQTARGMFSVVADHGGRDFSFSVRESVVNDLFEGGDAAALDKLRRIVELAALPFAGRRIAS